jgi:membrane protease YdiL (CAAX protease family)
VKLTVRQFLAKESSNMQKIRENKLVSSKTIFGLSLSLVFPLIYVLFISPVFLKPKVDEPLFTLINFSVLWVLAFGVLFFTRKIEKLPLTTIGWKSLSWKWISIAIGIGILLSFLVPVFTLLVSKIFPPSDTGTIAEVTLHFSWWILLLSVITAGVTEEILFRGYPLERLLESTSNKWISACVSLVFFVAIHATGWNVAHIIGVVIPLGIALTGLYFWKRNLLFVMIVHVIIDLPLVFIALLN